jgi:hypothetical protein
MSNILLSAIPFRLGSEIFAKRYGISLRSKYLWIHPTVLACVLQFPLCKRIGKLMYVPSQRVQWMYLSHLIDTAFWYDNFSQREYLVCSLSQAFANAFHSCSPGLVIVDVLQMFFRSVDLWSEMASRLYKWNMPQWFQFEHRRPSGCGIPEIVRLIWMIGMPLAWWQFFISLLGCHLFLRLM